MLDDFNDLKASPESVSFDWNSDSEPETTLKSEMDPPLTLEPSYALNTTVSSESEPTLDLDAALRIIEEELDLIYFEAPSL